MTRLNTTRFALCVLLIGSALATAATVQAQPMMGEMEMHHDQGRMQERMTRHWGARQAQLKTKLHLTPAQEPAWNAFVQNMSVTAKPWRQPIDRETLAKLTTPERMEKMNEMRETNLTAMHDHMKHNTEAVRTFYNQLSAEQQKVFDAETLPGLSRWKGQRD